MKTPIFGSLLRLECTSDRQTFNKFDMDLQQISKLATGKSQRHLRKLRKCRHKLDILRYPIEVCVRMVQNPTSDLICFPGSPPHLASDPVQIRGPRTRVFYQYREWV